MSLRGSPQRVPYRIIIGAILRRNAPNKPAFESELGTAFGFFDSFLYVVHWDQCDTGKTAAVVITELGEPIVVRAETRRAQSAVLDTVEKHPQTGVQHFALDTVDFLVFHALNWVPRARTHTRIPFYHLG